MNHQVGRYRLSELSLARLRQAAGTRIREWPHALAWRTSSEARRNRARLREYAGLHAGERCFIVANGPSLRSTGLELLRGEHTFGLNRIYLMFTESDFRPTYYVAMNELILEQFPEEIRSLKMPKFLNWNRRHIYGMGNEHTLFLKSRMVLRDAFQPDITRPLVVGGTVTFVAIQIAFYMGFTDVIVIGLDHSYVEKGMPSATEVRSDLVDRSHFHPAYFPPGSRWQRPDLLRAERDFALVEAAFRASGRRVRDATPGGQCPIFEKAEFESLFTGAQPGQRLRAGTP